MLKSLKFTANRKQYELKLGDRFEIDGQAAVVIEFFKDGSKRRAEVLTETVDEDGFTFVQRSYEVEDFGGFKRIKVIPAHIHEEAVAAMWRAKLLHSEEELAEAGDSYRSDEKESIKFYQAALKSKNKAQYEVFSLLDNFSQNKGEVIVYAPGYKREVAIEFAVQDYSFSERENPSSLGMG